MSDISIRPARPLPWPFGSGCLLCWLISKSLAVTQLIGFGAFADTGCNCSPAYVTGDRTSYITVTSDVLNTGAFPASNLVDGDMGQNGTGSAGFQNVTVAGKHITFTLSAARKITEAKWYQDITASNGTWKWQKDVLNNGTWVDIGSSFVIGGATTQTQTELSANTDGALAYRLLGVSGSCSSSAWLIEIEFKECIC